MQEVKNLPLVVQKFGGSSVATAERIMAAARRALRAKQAGNQVIVVVSARGDTTDELIALAREVTEEPSAREMDMHRGERGRVRWDRRPAGPGKLTGGTPVPPARRVGAAHRSIGGLRPPYGAQTRPARRSPTED